MRGYHKRKDTFSSGHGIFVKNKRGKKTSRSDIATDTLQS